MRLGPSSGAALLEQYGRSASVLGVIQIASSNLASSSPQILAAE